jgi:hypothetical protein
LPGPKPRGILCHVVSAVRSSPRRRVGGRGPLASPRIDSLHDPAPRCGRRDGDGPVGTHCRPVPAGRTPQPSFSSGRGGNRGLGLEAGLAWGSSEGWSRRPAQRRSGRPPSRWSSAWGSVRARSFVTRLRTGRSCRGHPSAGPGVPMSLFVAFNALRPIGRRSDSAILPAPSDAILAGLIGRSR